MVVVNHPTPRELQRLQFRQRRNGHTAVGKSSWSSLHNKILKHAGVGGKSHSLERGHVFWNRKGRW